jgi:photosystem II stability/assembly factor-like uncharacterized protein
MKRIIFTTLLISLAAFLSVTAQVRIYIPELSLPENNAVDQMPDVVLDWNAVTGGNTGVIKYDIQLDTDPAFGSPQTFQTELLTAVKTSELFFGETYFWRVRATDGNDVSGWSETWSFRVIRRVVLTGPGDASTQNDTTRLVWNTITGVTEYDYQIDTVYFWKSVNTGTTSNLFSVSVVDENNAWLFGAGGLILYYDGIAWTEQESTLSTDIYGSNFLDADNGWAVGKSGKIIHYNGTEWAAQTSGITTDLQAVDMIDANNGWAVGKSGTVLHYDGASWTTSYTASKDLNAVFAYDANHVWAVGKTGLIVFFNGSSWSVQETGSIKDFASVSFGSPNNGWVAGKTGTLFHYQDGAWTLYEHSLTTKDLTGIFFTSPESAYAVGKTGTLLAYDGIDWSSQSSTVSTNFNSVGFAGTTGFLAGETGVVIAYNDEAFSSPLAVIRHVSGTLKSVKISELLFGTQYYWRMKTKHNQDESEWSGARSFNTRATVTLDKPNNNSTDQNLDQLLQWKIQFSSDVTYEVQVDDDPAYGSPVYLATSKTSMNAEFLKFGLEYNWRVRVLHAFDISDWSESWKFTTINSITLTSPANESTDVKLSPLLSWKAQTGIAGYHVVLASNNAFSEVLVDAIVPVPESSFIVPVVLDKDAVYYWRVRAVNGLDTSGWSSAWSFRTSPPVGVDEPALEEQLSIYPNPVRNTLFIQMKNNQSATLSIKITDLVGLEVAEKTIVPAAGNKTAPVDVSFLRDGIYLLRITDDNNNSFTKKIIIKR